jgi:hypothetical protein
MGDIAEQAQAVGRFIACWVILESALIPLNFNIFGCRVKYLIE